ncbi:MAG: Subtilisin, partial [Bacteroidota bacterium]
MIRLLALLFFWQLADGVLSQNAPGFYWVQFSDKNGTPYSIEYPQAFLSERALQKRALLSKEITEQDLPVNPFYVQTVADSSGGTVHHVSKWFNAMTINLSALDSAA